MPKAEKIVRPLDALAEVSRRFGVPVSALKRRNGGRFLMRVRRAAATALYEEVGMSMAEIAPYVGLADHSSVLYLLRSRS